MAEFLAYQYPNEPLQVFSGRWHKLGNGEMPTGFVVSDAHGDMFYQFEILAHSDEALLKVALQEKDDIVSIPKNAYLKRCADLLAEMKSNDVPKVVFSRVHNVPCDEDQQWNLVFEQLLTAYPLNLNYFLHSDFLGTWMGSTPEVLIKSNHTTVFESMALAGTLSVSQPDSDWTDKERDEQQYVSDYLENIIKKHGSVCHKSGRYVHSVGPVKHLRTDFQFELPHEKRWHFVRDFHPTPAVCGVPKEIAKKLYEKHEAHERKLYTGLIGLFTENATKLYVNLRCMQLHSKGAGLYVGGGLTQSSVPEVEWEETERKAQTLGLFL
jgi:isochorismate synthase